MRTRGAGDGSQALGRAARRLDPDRRSAILTGSFFILGTASGLVGLGAVLEPLLSAADYLAAYGTMETRVLIASLLELLMSASLVAMAAAAYPVLRKHSPSAAVAYFGARVLEAVPVIVGVVSMLALTELGKEYVASGGGDASRFEPLGSILAGVPEWAGHAILDVAIFPFGASILYWTLFSARLVPRWLSVWGLLGAVFYWVAGILVMFHAVTPLTTPHILLQAPLGLQEMALAVWLIVRGFNLGATEEGAENA
ncbi:MAG: DUF4386 domain-containing protein [Spirochaetes bacterium]|nr:DUF4386 domain-containing protein [Spirochaetota bacterium]MBU1078873.1 DUF4386 domain-containing protein [Spirochaetota bacterium]